jgi:Arylsulfotransferase (ASST)
MSAGQTAREGLLVLGCLAALGASLSGSARAQVPGGGPAAADRAASGALRVVPFPGTPDTSPSTDVIFLTLHPSELRSVRVTGSRSGGHPGRLEPLPAGAGTAFVPARPFALGETVQVNAQLRSPQAGDAPGHPGATRVRYSFGVSASPPGIDARPSPRGQPGGWLSASGVGPTQQFRSAPDLHPPPMTVSADPDRGSGDIFVAPVNSPQVGPMILDARGRLLWWHPVTQLESTNLAVQRYHGQAVLTWWQGNVPAPGEDVIMSRSYRTVAVVHGGNGYQAELHEFQITPRGTAFITCFAPAYTNLTSVGGPPSGGVIDGLIQEVDIRTGKVLWEWHALGHVPLNASYTRYSKKSFYDFFHLNSIQQLPNGNLVISARNTWAVYEISRSTGRVIWTLGGKYSDFKMGRGTRFEWQHDARLHGHALTLLDDAADPQRESQSSAKELNIDSAARTVSLVRRFTHNPPLLSSASGSTQTLPNRNVFVGWGAQPQFSEYTPGGQQIFNASFALGVWTYRAFRFPWHGQPRTRPSLAVAGVGGSGGRVRVFASWNGATQVAAWRVLGGRRPGALRPLRVAQWSGFETRIDLGTRPRYLAVRALNAHGGVLGSSRTVSSQGAG